MDGRIYFLQTVWRAKGEWNWEEIADEAVEVEAALKDVNPRNYRGLGK